MKAITVRILPATNTKGLRYVADDGDGNRLTLPERHGADVATHSGNACRALCEKMGWKGTLVAGWVMKKRQMDAMVWVWADGPRLEL